MIISASRRTDIPAFYADWLVKRFAEGFVYVRNPRNFKQVSRIPLNPSVVDGIVFWTKNPTILLPLLNNFKAYNYYFQFTLTLYDQTIEPYVGSKENIIKRFQTLSTALGKYRVIWRYDPILLTNTKEI